MWISSSLCPEEDYLMELKGLNKSVMNKYVSSEIHRVLKVRAVWSMKICFNNLIQAELEIDEYESMEDLFSEAFDKIEDARMGVDRMQHARVSLLIPPCRE